MFRVQLDVCIVIDVAALYLAIAGTILNHEKCRLRSIKVVLSTAGLMVEVRNVAVEIAST